MIKEFIQDYIDEYLRSQGFRKRRTTWNREVSYGVQVFDIQLDKCRDIASQSFTVNVGLLVEDVWNLCWDKPRPRFVQEVQCYPRFRLARLLNDFKGKCLDQWWELTADSMCELGEEMDTILKGSCIPFFEEMKSEEQVLQFVNNRYEDGLPLERIQRAVLLGLHGYDVDEQFEDFARDDYWGGFASRAKARLDKHVVKNSSKRD